MTLAGVNTGLSVPEGAVFFEGEEMEELSLDGESMEVKSTVGDVVVTSGVALPGESVGIEKVVLSFEPETPRTQPNK